jgi:DNA-binding CsgD family transcriptional regulator
MEELGRQREAITSKNHALNEVLAKVEEQRRHIAAAIHENVQRAIMPLLQKLRRRAEPETEAIIDQLDHELADITAPFADQLTRRYHSLTPTEIRICNLIRRGMSSKEIASAEGITAGTVSVHREHIRRKLQLTNSKVNLATFLRNMSDDRG